MKAMDIALFGSSLVSAYWNGAATYYRGLIRALHGRGHRVHFFEPDAFERQRHRDIPDPDWARVTVYPVSDHQGVEQALEQARGADVLIKASGVGIFDTFLEAAMPDIAGPNTLTVYWDVDAPATLERLQADPDDPLHAQISRYDLVLTYGGGNGVSNDYQAMGARQCIPIYNALDPETHFPVPPDARFQASLGFLGNRLPDREARVERFFLDAARRLPEQRFLLGGNGWDAAALPANVDYQGHIYTQDHNAFNCTALAVLNIARDSMARYGHAPATRVFEAAGAGACLITDRWDGLEAFLTPGREVLVADDGEQVADWLQRLDRLQARAIGAAARRRLLAQHTYAHRAVQLEAILQGDAAQNATLEA